MKVCARCRRAQYCSEKCPYTSLSAILCWIFHIVVVLSFFPPFPFFCTFHVWVFSVALVGFDRPERALEGGPQAGVQEASSKRVKERRRFGRKGRRGQADSLIKWPRFFITYLRATESTANSLKNKLKLCVATPALVNALRTTPSPPFYFVASPVFVLPLSIFQICLYA